MGNLWQDIRYGVRSLLKRPGFVVIAVMTLALGIGANTAMFTVVNAVLLRPLSYPEPERLVVFDGINPGRGITLSNMSVPDFVDWQNQNQTFEHMAGFIAGGAFLVSGDQPERVRATAVTAEFFPLFRTNVLEGRALQPGVLQPGPGQ